MVDAPRFPPWLPNHLENRKPKAFMETPDYGQGSFLIANPVLPDPNFSRTVVLLCNHNDEGSFGLVVNRKAEFDANEIFPEIDLLKDYKGDIYIGGPVQQSQVFYLVQCEEELPGLEKVCPNVHLGMSWEHLEDVYARLKDPKEDLRFFIGYSGWGPGQLAGEMEQRSWLIHGATSECVFSTDPDHLWHEVVRSMGREYEYLLNAPVDPRMN